MVISPFQKHPVGPARGDDRAWFEQNQSRSHRARMPFPGEVDEEAAKAPAGSTLIILVRQIEPGARLRSLLYLNTDLLLLPDDEGVIHALFEVATKREPWPRDGEAFCALVRKYRARTDGGAP